MENKVNRSVEHEIKILLSEEQHAAVKERVNWTREYVQTNHYYSDDGGVLRNEHTTLRIRDKNGKFTLQAKLPAGEVNTHKEVEMELDSAPETLASSVAASIIGKELHDIKDSGTLTTKRREYEVSKGILLCLDENDYLGTKDWELEVEYDDGCFSEAAMLIDTFDLDSHFEARGGNGAPGKASRFFERLAKVKS